MFISSRNRFSPLTIISECIILWLPVFFLTNQSEISLILVNYVNLLPFGSGEMNVQSNIFIDSPFIRPVRLTDMVKRIKYPLYFQPFWVPGKHDPGYIPEYQHPSQVLFTELHNTVFTTECVIVKPDGYHLFKESCHPRYWGEGQKYHYPHITFQKYHSVICVGHQHTSDWGHWFLEVFPALLAIPKSIRITSNIAVPFKTDFIIDNLMAIDVDPRQIIEGDNMPIFAEHFYTVLTTFCGDLNSFLLMNLRNHLVKLYDLDKVRPKRFVIINRPPGTRHIGNFRDLMDELRKQYPIYPWEEVTFYKDLKSQAIYFNQICFLFAVHGSILANELFMMPKTVCIELQMEKWLLSFIYLGPMTGKIVIEGRDCGISYKNERPNFVDKKYFMKLIKVGLEKGHRYNKNLFPKNV